jgi:DNA-binding NarL/FixJ family response regulator
VIIRAKGGEMSGKLAEVGECRALLCADGLGGSKTTVAPVKILLADDHDIVRRGLRELINRRPEWKIVAEAANGREAVTKAAETRPHVALLDISMPFLNGFEAARQILLERPQTKILILTVHESNTLIRQVLEAGARGYVLKSDAERDLVAAVEAVCSGGTYFTQKVSEVILDFYLNKGTVLREETPDQRLTKRHREIVQLLAEGRSSKEVANILNLTLKTAETHRAHIMKRMGFHSVADLVRYALRNGIIEA